MFVIGILALYNLVFNESFPKHGVKASLKSILDTLTPVFVYSGFIPVFHNVLEVYNCNSKYKGDEFLDIDCYQDCWSTDHYIYMTLGGVALAVYIPTTMMLRVEWQAYNHDLNILVNPIHLIVTTVFHVAVVVLKKSMRYDSELAFSFMFIVLVAVFMIYFIKIRPCSTSRQHLATVLT
jgi:hypothetical protein